MQGAKAVLINITGGLDMTLYEVDEAANRIREEVDADAHIIFGSTFDEALQGKIRVSCVATGIDAHVTGVVNKGRIAQMEKEIEEASSKEEESIDSFSTLQQDLLITDFEEDEESLQLADIENTSPYGEVADAYTSSASEEDDRPLSFFDRLMGRKNQPTRPSNSSKQTRPQPLIQSTDDETVEEEEAEIPAFLRRQSNR
jgi:cell division protein FtsZ